MKRVIFVLICFSLSTVLKAQEAVKDYKPRSIEILEFLKKKEFGKVTEQFDTSVSRRLDSTKLATVWLRMVGAIGSVQRVDSISTDHQATYDVVIQHCVFEKKKIDFKLVYGTNEKIKGLFFLPVDQKQHYELPPYNKPEVYEEKNFPIMSGEYTLPGILTMPKGSGRYPVLILIHGSGPNDKDESVGATKIFKDIAIGLAGQGIAVLRYDKRSRVAGKKMADMMKTMTTKEETTEDVLAAIATVKKEIRVDTNQIFLLGHSLGGMMLPRINSNLKGMKGLIYLAANSRPLEELFYKQAEHILSVDGLSSVNQHTLDSIHTEMEKVKKLKPENAKDTGMILRLPYSYWVDLNGYNPVKAAAGDKTPMLFLQGGRDYQVTGEDLTGWENGLKSKKNARFKTYPKLNHFFIEGEGVSTPAEYAQKGNVASSVIDDIASWIQLGQIK
ncbi:MAG TPA: alpha/beta hydrolase [Bacteroidia bacterium]|nr:alpha/beta hydrolase [Bacteroidia bacterium]